MRPSKKRLRHEVLPWRGLLSNTSGYELTIPVHRHSSIRWVKVVEKRDGIEPGRNRNQACRCAVAAPDPLSRSLHHSGANRIQNDVTSQLQEIGLAVDQMALETSLKEMPDTPMAFVEIGCVVTVKILYAEGQVRVRCSEQKMVVVGEQDPGEQLPSVLGNRFL
jgi:hypothetical protein